MRKIFIGLLAVCMVKIAGGQALSDLVEKHTYPLRVEEGKLRGQGGELLLFEATKAEILIIGEEEGVADIPEIIWSIYQHAYKIGLKFDHVALNISPFLAQWLQETALEANATEILKNYFEEHRGEIPYLELAVETALIESVLETASSDANVLWGLAPENILGARAVLERLKVIAPDKNTEKLIDRFLVDAEKDREELFEKQDTSSIFFFSTNIEALEKLKETYEEDKEGIRLINELIKAQDILLASRNQSLREVYQKSAQVMKDNFRYYYDQVRSSQVNLPRVIVKLPYEHAFNGTYSRSKINTPGSYFVNQAKTNNQKSFNMLVIAGTQDSVSMWTKTNAYKVIPGIAGQEWFQPLIQHLPSEGFSLINFSAVRDKIDPIRARLDDQLVKVLEEYDVLLVVGGSHPATYH